MSLSNLRQAFSGSADGNGNCTIAVPANGSLYSLLSVVGQTSGNPLWTVSVGGQAVDVSTGPNTVLGPIIVLPNESMTIQLSGCVPNAQVSGSLVGVQSAIFSEVTQNYSPAPHPVTVRASTQSAVSLTFTTSVLATKTVNPSPGTVALRIVASLVGGGAITSPYLIAIAGHTTGAQYFPAIGGRGAPYSFVEPLVVPIDTSIDAAYDIQFDPTPETIVVNVSSLGLPEVMEVYAQQTLPVQLVAPSVPAFTVGAEQSAVGTAGLQSGSPGLTIHVWGWELQVDNGGSAVSGIFVAYIESSTGGVTNRIGTIAAGNGIAIITGNESGAPIIKGDGLRLNVVAAGASGVVRARAAINQV